MDRIHSTRFSEKEVDDMIEDYQARFGGEEKWKRVGDQKFIAVKGAPVEYNTASGDLSIYQNLETGLAMLRILEVKQEIRREKEREAKDMKTCIYGCCSYPSD